MKGVIQYGTHQIAYTWEYRERSTLEIAVMPDGAVHVKAPVNTDPERIQSRIFRRAAWIMKQQRYFEQFAIRTPERQYVGGETHLYLGKQYRLKLTQSERTTIKLTRGFIWISSPDLSADAIRNILTRYYRVKAKEKYGEYLQLVAQRMNIQQLPRMQIRAMKTNWGSMSPGGVLMLNPELIKAPPQCLEYVITHELCHLKHREHDEAFFCELRSYLPDWNKRKNKLELALL